MALFEVTALDRAVYEQQIRDFLPDEIIDIHTHVWLEGLRRAQPTDKVVRTVTWPSLVARDNSVEDLIETYELMFPGKRVTPLMFSSLNAANQIDDCNRYVADCAHKTGFPALYYSGPEQSAAEVERALIEGGFLGLKSYLDLAPSYLPEAEIRIFDFFPPHQLELIDRMGLIVMLHIPRHARLRDRVNLQQILEIVRRYPRVKLIIAHIGRAYCECDVGDAFEVLAEAKNLLFDFSANCCESAMTKLLKAVGPERAMFGSDLPILRMRTRRIEEDGTYINLVPPGLYGDTSQDSHLREVSRGEGEKLTFFLYEEILAFKRAAVKLGLTKDQVRRVFFGNADALIREARNNLAGWAGR